MEKKTKVIVLGAIYNDKGEILVSQRNEPQVPDAHLKWDLIGGKNEFGESPKETIIREALEETGLSIITEGLLPEIAQKTWQYDDHLLHILALCYKCKVTGGALKLQDPKMSDLKWAKIEELGSYDLLPTVRTFIELLK